MARFTGALVPEDRRRFVPFEYLFDGLTAGTASVPVVLMDWAPGIELGPFLDMYHADGARLTQLRDGLADLAAFLDEQEFAHGDLQVGNLFVGEEGRLVMIDYDGAWLPELNRLDQREYGHINFQHPLREESRPGPSMDRFSLITMDVALQALSGDASLWERFSSGESTLFTQADFVDPAASPLFGHLSTLRGVAIAADLFAGVCTGAYEDVPSLSSFREACRLGKPSPARVKRNPVGKALRRPYRGQYPVVAATDVDAIVNLVGRKAEVVGRILGVKLGTTRNGDPFRFVNFSDWRGRAFKVNVWRDALEEYQSWPDESWVGRWVSVTGLVDEPFVSEAHGYRHFSITANNRTQICVIDEEEAKMRLGVLPSIR